MFFVTLDRFSSYAIPATPSILLQNILPSAIAERRKQGAVFAGQVAANLKTFRCLCCRMHWTES